MNGNPIIDGAPSLPFAAVSSSSPSPHPPPPTNIQWNSPAFPLHSPGPPRQAWGENGWHQQQQQPYNTPQPHPQGHQQQQSGWNGSAVPIAPHPSSHALGNARNIAALPYSDAVAPSPLAHARSSPPTLTQHPMAAPQLPHTPIAGGGGPQQQQQPQPQQQQQQHLPPQRNNSNISVAPLSPPQSPGGVNGPREQARISLLFEINVLLLQEVNRLQALGQGGATNPQQVAQLKAAGQPDKTASDEYVQCLRRVQANLAYLMPKAQKEMNPNAAETAKQTLAGPAHMTPPPSAENIDILREKYEQLRELFPGWPGFDHRLSGSSASPRPGAAGAPGGGMSAQG